LQQCLMMTLLIWIGVTCNFLLIGDYDNDGLAKSS
jgi:hypothetical protein